MSRNVQFELDRLGGSDVLRDRARSEIDRIAESIAAEVRAAGVNVEVYRQTSDRARAVVAIAEPNGAAIEARSGLLRRAALARGLEFRGSR